MKKEFKAESKRLLEMMVNSIYSKKEVFLRELISNASDAIDKIYYKTLTDETLTFNQSDYYIKVIPNKEERTLTIVDTGIGMTEEELENNLGTIAQSGSLAFKAANEAKDGYDIIGQFGVGFYAAFMVADNVTVISKALGSPSAYKWQSTGTEGYTIEPAEKETVGTEITLTIKANTEDENYDEFLEAYSLQSIIKTYSDFIRYPIKMDGENEEEIINSMVPLWRKNKNELTEGDYEQFYHEKHYGFDKPLKYVHTSVDGTIRYNAILYIPEKIPFNYYSREFEKGLELYSNSVLIMNKCPELLPDHFSFVKGMVDSEDLSLNISREILQHDRQLKLIAKNISKKIKSELQTMLKKDRENYEKFFESFGRQLKLGVYNEFGTYKDELKDLLMFYSSTEKKMVTLAEYMERMKEEQKYIYYATGETNERIEKLPQTELVADKGYEILYFTDEIDEFAIKVLHEYNEKEFKSVSSDDLGIDEDETTEETTQEENKDMFTEMKNILADKVAEVKISKRLKSHPVCFLSTGEVSIEMEKILSQMPENQHVKASKVLEINPNHEVFNGLKQAFANDKEKLELYTNLLYNQALLIEGLPINDPVAFTDSICKIMI